MNKNDMISVPRELAERIDSALCAYGETLESVQLQEFLAKPAEQHQVEPVAAFENCVEARVFIACLFCERLGRNDFNQYITEQLAGDFALALANLLVGEVDRLSQIIRDLNDERDEIGAEAGRLRAQLAKPVEQHQGEPVTLPACITKLSMSHDWDQGYADGWKGCLEEAAKLGPLYIHTGAGEVERLRGQPVQRWLIQKTPIGTMMKPNAEGGWVRYEDVAQADAGEVERLRQRLLAYEEVVESHADACAVAVTKLAERDALLRRWVGSFGHLGGCATPLRDETNTSLSASAEPIEGGAK